MQGFETVCPSQNIMYEMSKGGFMSIDELDEILAEAEADAKIDSIKEDYSI